MILMDDLYFVKLGGSVITDTAEEEKAKIDEIERLLSELYEAKKEKGFKLLIGHGGGSFPHVPAKKYGVNDGMTEDNRIGVAITHNSAQKLNRIVVDAGIKLGMPVFPFSASSFLLSSGGSIVSGHTGSIEEALNRGLIPVVYGDVALDLEKGSTIVSTEDIFAYLAKTLGPKAVILGTDVDGIFDKDPKDFGDAKLIDRVDSGNVDSITESAGGSQKVDVTGGMKSKVRTLYSMIKGTGSKGYIANATKPGLIKSILTGSCTSGFTLVEN